MLDGLDGEKLPVIEELRRAHIEKYGSFLRCPKRDTICSFMEEALCGSGKCERDPCILDDPEYLKLQERIAKNVKRNAERVKREREEEKMNPPAPIRTQNKYPEDDMWARIQRLEQESREAYKRNKPKIGESKLHEAILLRRKMRRQIGE